MSSWPVINSFRLFVCLSQLIGSLEEVHMPQNGINHQGITALAGAMKHNADLRVLNLNDNTFTKKGALAMAEVNADCEVVFIFEENRCHLSI